MCFISSMLKQFKTRILKDAGLNSSPLFNESTAGNPYQERLAGQQEVGENVLRVVKSYERTGTFVASGVDSTFVETFKHNLQYFPLVFGFVKIWKEGESDSIHTIPYMAAGGDLNIMVSEVTKSEIKVEGYSLYLGGELYNYRVRLRLCEEI